MGLRRATLLALTLKGAGAAGWAAYVWALSLLLPPVVLGQTLSTLALAGFGAAALSAGWAQAILRDGARDPHALRPLLRRARLHCARRMLWGLPLSAVILFTDRLPPQMLALGLILTAALTLTTLAIAALRAQGALTTALLLQAPLKLTLALALLWPLPEAALAGHTAAALLTLLIAATALRRIPQGAPTTAPPDLRALTAAQLGTAALHHLDVIVLSLMLPAPDAALYLIARRLAGMLGLIFDALRLVHAPGLARAHGTDGFTPQAQRANRAFALLGGGMAGGAAALGPLILPLFSLPPGPATGILWALIAAQAAPALFGATGMVMTMARLEPLRARLIWGLLPLATAALLWAAPLGPLPLACAMAGVTLTLHGAAAHLLWRRIGLRPIGV